jgi:hypothetical protein
VRSMGNSGVSFQGYGEGDACTKKLEATAGFGPANGSFADSCLATWLRRLSKTIVSK